MRGRNHASILRLAGTVLALLLPCAAAAEPAASPAANPLRAGAWSVRLGVYFSESSTAGVSFKRHFTDRSALQLQVRSRVTTDNEDDAYQQQDYDTTSTSQVHDERSTFVEVMPAYVFYPRASGHVLPVLTAGPFASYSHSVYVDRRIEVNEPATGRSRDVTDTWRIGAQAHLGFEWFFTRQLGLGTDVGIAIGYAHGRTTHMRRNESAGYLSIYDEIDKDQRFEFDTRQLGLSLSYYF